MIKDVVLRSAWRGSYFEANTWQELSMPLKVAVGRDVAPFQQFLLLVLQHWAQLETAFMQVRQGGRCDCYKRWSFSAFGSAQYPHLSGMKARRFWVLLFTASYLYRAFSRKYRHGPQSQSQRAYRQVVRAESLVSDVSDDVENVIMNNYAAALNELPSKYRVLVLDSSYRPIEVFYASDF